MEFSPQVIAHLKSSLDKMKITAAGRFCYRFMPYRKHIVLANLEQVFGHVLSSQERERLAQAFYSHLLTSIRENLALSLMSQQRIKENAIVVGHEKALEAVEKNKGLILLTGHFGNWELGPIAGILNFPEFQNRIHFIRRQQSVEWIGQFLFRRFTRAGLKVIVQGNSLTSVVDVLEQNQAVVFVMDQHPPLGSKDGIMVDFFGKPAGTYRSVASLARYTGVPVMPVTTYRNENGQHVLEFFDPLPWQAHDNAKTEIELNTRAYNAAIEDLVMRHPEQWLWLYKRWKKPKYAKTA